MNLYKIAMNKMKYILSVLVFGLVFTGCKNNVKQTDEEIEKELSIEEIVNESLSGDQRSQEQNIKDTVSVGGKVYTYEIHRISSDDLPTVKGDFSHNAVFYDNTASLKVSLGDKVIYSNTFTKKSFANFVESEMMSKSILEGLVFDHAIKGGIQFAAAVGYPQEDDMYVPLLIKVMTDGSVKIEKDPLSSTASEADLEPETGESDADLGV